MTVFTGEFRIWDITKCFQTAGRFEAINDIFEIDEISCEGCGICAYFCPENAIKLVPNKSGEW
ncbi:4Fe-4S binding protein, partial [candidate division KSB1 bacterium]